MSNIALGLYKYVDGVNDTPFPSSANQAFLVDWQYGARRMGGAPSITGGTINHTICLDNDWSMDVYVEYKGEKFFPSHKPTSSYSAQSITYEHKVDFYSERLVLDNVYFYDVVSSGDSGGKPVSNSTKFTFFGNITEFIARLNASMQKGNTGYSVVLDPNQANADLEKQIKFDTKYISEALQEGFKAFGIPYYFVGKVCHYGDSQSSAIDNIVFEYGKDNSLMSIEKTNANTKIVNRITGVGSSDNIPYYYPNSCEQGVVDIANLSSSTITNLEIFDDMLFAKKVKRDAVLTYNTWSFNVETPIFYLDGKPYTNGKGFSSDEIAQGQALHVVVPFEVKYDGCTDLVMRFSVSPVATIISNISLSPAISGVTPTANNGVVYVNAVNKNIAKGKYQLAFDVNISTFSLILQTFKTESCTIYANGWKDNKDGNFYKDLEEIGIMMTGTASANDNFKQVISKYIPPQSNLMPSIYRNSDGDERFYNAANNTYVNPDTGEYYEFPNPYANGKPKEFIKDYKDVKPTIAGAVNSASEPIDQIIKFAYDANDNDETDEEGNYIHPYFFALLHKTNGTYGFNLFDHTIDEGEMSLSFTSGRMGGCEFVIGVGEDSQKNLVQIVLDGNLQPQLDEDGHPILARDTETGDVICGREGQGKQIPQDWQNDTRRNEVWVALKKDSTTYGVIMPNATNNYRPSDDEVNEFVILHIDLPKAYILAAEQSIDNLLISYMAESNTEHWNFGIDFSRIYLKDTPNIANALDENKKIKIRYNGEIYSRYVLGYTYKTLIGEPLPSISIELAESLEGSSSALDTAINEINNMVEQQAQAMIGYQQVARLARGALQASNVEGAGSSTRPIYFDGHEAKTVDGIEVPENIRTQKNVEAMWGVAAYGMASLAINGGGGQGTVTAINFAGSPEQIYTPSDGLITLPDYPTAASLISDGLASQNYVASYFASNFTQLNIKNTLGISDWALAASKPSYNFSEIGSKPTTLAGYGITDAYIANGVVTLGGNTITPATLTNGKIPLSQIPDAILGQLIYGGTVNGSGVVTLSQNAKDKWGITSLTLTSTNYSTYEGAFFIASADATSGVPSTLGLLVGDWVVATASGWGKIDNTDAVTGVKGSAESNYRIGNVNITPANIGLGNVENTALSTWTGTIKIVTLGTITTGVWHGSAIADDYIASASAWNAKYDKPSGGIPKTDLASAVQTSLGKADTALQSHQTIYSLTIKKNGTQVGSTYNPASAAQTIDITDVASANALSGVTTRVGTLEGYFTSGVANNAAQLGGQLPSYYAKASDYTKTTDFQSFSIKAGSTTLGTYSPTSALIISLVAGSNISFTPDATNHKLTINNTYSYTLPMASSDSRGGIRVGNTLNIDSNGILNANIYDGLDQGYTTYALSAKQGKVLNTALDTLKTGLTSKGAHNLPIYLNSSAEAVAIDSLSVSGNVESTAGGVSASGIASLALNGGGGQGTLTQIQVNGVALADTSGVVNITATTGNANGKIAIAGQQIPVYGLGSLAYLSSLAFTDLSSHPTTLGGYGITDAKIANGVITLGSNTITPLTSHQTLYNLVINNSAGTAQITYKPAVSGTYALTLTKAMVGLSNVENTKLSTWTGSANITTLGTITTGKWQGTAIADSYIASAATWNAKQDAISDLATIRSRADEGHTAYGYFSGTGNTLPNNKLVNSSISIAGTSVSLGGSITAATLKSNLGLGASAYIDYDTEVTQDSTKLITSGAVYNAIDNLPEPMIMKGTLGTNGTITSLPTASASNEGFTYKVITAGTYASQAAKVGDVFVSCKPVGASAYEWILIPAGDTDSDTWRNINVNGTQLLGTAISSGAVNFKNGGNITLTGSGNDITLGVASGYAIPTTAKQGNWDTAYGWGNHASAGYALASNLGTASTHAHGDYVTAITYDSTNRKLQQSKGGGTATDIVTFGTNAFNSTAYLPLSGGTLNGQGTYVLGLKNSESGATSVGLIGSVGNTLSGILIFGGDWGTSIINPVAGYSGIGVKNDGTPYFGGSTKYKLWHEGNDGSGSGLDADLLDGTHKADLFTAFTNDNDQLSSTIGGTNKKVTVGYASRSTDTKTELLTEQEFIYRQTAGGGLTYKPSAAVINRILGNSVVWNQRANLGALAGNNTTRTLNDTGFTSTAVAGSAEKNCVIRGAFANNGHSYYLSFDYKSNLAYEVQDMNSARSMAVASNWTHNSKIGVCTSSSYTPLYWYLYATTTEAWNLEVKNITIIDLTLFFNGNIPANLTPEQFEEKYNIHGFYEPNAGTIINNAAEGLETVGFNLWDEEWENGGRNGSTGEIDTSYAGTWITCKNLIDVIPSQTYYLHNSIASRNTYIYFFSEDGTYISRNADLWTSGTGSFVTPNNCGKIAFAVKQATLDSNICVNLSNTSKNGTYEPYRRIVTDLNLDAIQVKSHNIWDEVSQRGYWNASTGQHVDDNNWVCSVNPISVKPNTIYRNTKDANNFIAVFYDKNMNWVGYVDAGRNVTFTTPANAYYMHFYGSAGMTYCCINESSSFNGQYEPHGILTINGLKQAGSVRDERVGKKFIRRVGSVDLGTLTWSYANSRFTATAPNDIVKIPYNDTTNLQQPNLICGKYVTSSPHSLFDNAVNNVISMRQQSGAMQIAVIDSAYSTAAAFKSAMSGVYAYYELATPIEYEIIDEAPYEYPIDTLGTERIVSDELVAPFVADIQYGAEQRDIAVDINNLHISAGLLSNRAYALESYFTDGIAKNAARLSNTSAIGSTTKPVYFTANGVPSACSDYAGGTAVTLNGTSKAASTASFYAPTGAGTSGQILKSTAGTPEWINQSAITAGKATILETTRTIWGQNFNGSANVTGDMSSVGNIAFSASGKNIGGTMYFDTTNHRVGVNDSTPSCAFDVTGDIQASGGVAAGGILNLAYNGAGTQGTLTQIQINGRALTDSSGIVNIPLANTTSTGDGAMSHTDKLKLDGIATGATNVTTDTVAGWGYVKDATGIANALGYIAARENKKSRLVTGTEYRFQSGDNDCINIWIVSAASVDLYLPYDWDYQTPLRLIIANAYSGTVTVNYKATSGTQKIYSQSDTISLSAGRAALVEMIQFYNASVGGELTFVTSSSYLQRSIT